MHPYEYLQECLFNALLCVGNSHIRLESKLMTRFYSSIRISAQLAFSIFLTVFSARSNWNAGQAFRAKRLPAFRQHQVHEVAFYSADFCLDI